MAREAGGRENRIGVARMRMSGRSEASPARQSGGRGAGVGMEKMKKVHLGCDGEPRTVTGSGVG